MCTESIRAEPMYGLVFGLAFAVIAPGALRSQNVPHVVVDPASSAWKAEQAWTLSPDPRLVIGEFDGADEYVLFRTYWATRLSDGRIAILNAGAHEVRVFSASGTHLYSFGREGDGPGEFRQPDTGVLLPNDSILIQDGYRASVFSADGDFARSFRIEGGRVFPPPQLLGRLGGALVLRDGDVASRTFEARTDGRLVSQIEPGLDQGHYSLVRYKTDGVLIDTLAVVRGGDSWLTVTGRSQSYSGVPYGRSQQTGVGVAGLATGWNGDFAFSLFDGVGQQTHRVSMNVEPTQIAQADLRAIFDRRVAAYSSLGGRRRARQRLEAMIQYSTLPAFGTVHVDPLGYIWVSSYFQDGLGQDEIWWVLNPQGELQGTIPRPRMRVLEVGVDYVLGRVLDELDVERIVVYDLQRTRR